MKSSFSSMSSTNFPTDACNKVGGQVFYNYCAAKGLVTQLSTKLPGDTRWYSNFPTDVCNQFNGGVFYNSCAAERPASQMTTKVPGHTYSSNVPSEVCSRLDGGTFYGYCAARGYDRRGNMIASSGSFFIVSLATLVATTYFW